MAALWALYTVAKENGKLPFKKDVKNKHIFLTGAGSGLGRLMALKFAKLGAKLTLADINEQGLKETSQQIKEIVGHDLNVNLQ